MMDKKHNEPQDDSYYDALIKQRIGEALRNQSRKERLDLAQLEEWVEADRQRRRAKVKRILAVASCFIILCIGTFSLKFVFDPDDSIATAGKNDNKVTEEGNNVVVKPNEDGVDENIGERTASCDTWEAVKELQKEYEELLIPGYIPAKYEFKSLQIDEGSAVEQYTYTYSDGNDKLTIIQYVGGDVKIFNSYDRAIEGDNLKVFVKEGADKRCFLQHSNNSIVSIISNIDDNEILKIFSDM